MRILLLSFYYPPDLCAGSFRAGALVAALRALPSPPHRIDVITTQPNRYSTHRAEAAHFEQQPGLSVRRIALPHHDSGMADQARAFSRFALEAMRHSRDIECDMVVATSSRLMSAALGAMVARRKGVPLYLDIRDLFVDTMEDIGARLYWRPVLAALRFVERRTFRQAVRINVVSEGFLPYLREIAPDGAYRTFTNGIDPEFLSFSGDAPPRRPLARILYAGNIGQGQGLEKLIPAAAKRLAGQAEFRIIGDGGRRKMLEEGLRTAGTANVAVLPPVRRAELVEEYAQADVLLMHLNDLPAFRRVLPSKVFEYAATGKRILAGVAGYAADFVRKEVPGTEIFAPCDADGLVAAFGRLESAPQMVPRGEFLARYERSTIMRDMAFDILATRPAP
jgi:glycosyltransferase involved in cell wall biosynthesis